MSVFQILKNSSTSFSSFYGWSHFSKSGRTDLYICVSCISGGFFLLLLLLLSYCFFMLVFSFRSLSQKPQECHIYQLFPPTLSCPSSPIRSPLSPSLSPSLSPIPLSSPSAGLMRVSSVQTLLESSFMHSGLKFTEVKATLTHSY